MTDPNFHPLPFSGDLPVQFAYPHHYVPHPVAVAAADALREHLRTQTDFDHDFGLADPDGLSSRGKMFGVLVVQTGAGDLGYLAAFSGKLADANHHPGFVPPVYDLLNPEAFYKRGEREVMAVNDELDRRLANPELDTRRAALAEAEEAAAAEIAAERKALKAAKKERAARREAARGKVSEEEYAALDEELSRQSFLRNFALRDLRRDWAKKLDDLRGDLAEVTDSIEELQELRKQMSNDLQRRIFANYAFLNARGERRDLNAIFAETVFVVPPAGAGECAAPKLFQYAFERGYQPVALAEFWWGQSPKGELRRHGNYYPACNGKCRPILGHMLEGMNVQPSPLQVNPAVGKDLDVIYEDDDLLVIVKPDEFLSVPGVHISDSVQTRLRERYPRATGPMIVHRLDMSTSGLMLVTKRKAIHKQLQKQFFKRSIRKRYVALLEGRVGEVGQEGYLDLPLRQSILDRPRQVVDHENGKPARTRYRIVAHEGDRTRIDLWPVTGRTHQLRVHCAHPSGLNAPMVGDNLYGVAGERLCLHATWIAFLHPGTREEVEFLDPPPF